MKNILTLLFVLGSVLLFAQEPTKEELPEEVEPIEEVQEFVMVTTEMTFEETSFDFGKIMDGEKVEHVFVFTNTGNVPLMISNAKGSCGCTVPQWPKNPIAPGATGEIKVVYNSKNKGKVGGRNEKKTVTITANTDPAQTRIFIQGVVDKDE